ncbi:hypothetical protein HY797_00745 [Candidatus Falkowbacteria bacterium]|nr:hypothetical protein [Candidatus Falkowbacteria bacterium]
MNKALFLTLIIILSAMAVFSARADNLSDRLRGRILLQTESKGEAWYVNPVNKKRLYLGRTADAFAIMRNLGWV